MIVIAIAVVAIWFEIFVLKLSAVSVMIGTLVVIAALVVSLVEYYYVSHCVGLCSITNFSQQLSQGKVFCTCCFKTFQRV